MEILVLGEDVGLQVSGYTDGARNDETDLFTYKISAQEVVLKQYLLDYTRNNTNSKIYELLSNVQVYNLYARALDRYFQQNLGFASEYDLLAEENYERIVTFVYKVDFPQRSEKEISVSYKTAGTMDRTKTAEPLYTFIYLFNPAHSWREFQQLNVEIIPPEDNPYLLDSSMEFIKGEDGVYKSSTDRLPEKDLSFALYSKEKITFGDKAQGYLHNSFGYLAPLVVGGLALIASGLLIFFIRKITRI